MKVWNYMMIMLTMMIFLSFIGFAPEGSGDFLNQTGIQINGTTGQLVSSDLSNSSWFNKIFDPITGLIFVILTSGAVIVGLFTRSFDWKLALVGFFTAFVYKFVTLGLSIVTLAGSSGDTWLIAIIATIFLPLTVMFIFSVVEWFGGAGTG